MAGQAVRRLDRARQDRPAPAGSPAAQGEELRAISERLHDEQLASKADHLQAKTRAADELLKAEGARANLHRLSVARRHDERQAAAHVAELERSLGDLLAEQRAAEAAVHTALAQMSGGRSARRSRASSGTSPRSRWATC